MDVAVKKYRASRLRSVDSVENQKSKHNKSHNPKISVSVIRSFVMIPRQRACLVEENENRNCANV